MPELLPSPGPLVTAEMPSSGVSPEQVAQPYRELADTLKAGSEATETAAETTAKYAGLQAGANAQPGPNGVIQIPKAPIIGPASQNYEAAVKMGVLAKGEGQAKDAARQLMLDHIDDPEGYRVASNALRDKTIQLYADAGAPDVGIALGRAIDSSTTFTYRMLVNQKRSIDLHEAAQNINDGITEASDNLHALARGGDTSSPQFQQAWSKFAALTQQRTQIPGLAYSPDKARFDTDQLHAALQGDVFLHHIDQVYKDPTANPDGRPKGGASAALTAAQSILTDASIPLSPAQRQQFYSKAVGEIRANEALRRQDVASARAAETALDEESYLGVPIDPQDVSRVGQAYIDAGDPASAARLYAKMSRKPLNDDFGRQPLGEQLDQLRTLRSGANPSSAAEAALIQHESGGHPGLVNGLGYAGLYQFGAPLMTDLGLYHPGPGENIRSPYAAGGWSGRKWSGTFDIPGFPQVKTLPDFLANPAAQKAAFDIHVANMDKQIAANGMEKYIGQTVAGVPITREGLHAMIHLAGVQGTLTTLQTGGRITVPDANGTTPLMYAREAAAATHGNPASNMWLAANRSRTVDTNARTAWTTVMSDYDKTGQRPANSVIATVLNAANLTGDGPLLDQIASDTDRMDLTQRFGLQPLPTQAAALGALEQAGAEGALSPGQSASEKDMQRKYETINKGLQTDPVKTTVANFSDRFQIPAPLDLKDPNNFAAGLAQRARIAQFAAQNWQSGPVSALDSADLAQVKGALQNADPAAKAQIFQGLATLPPDVRGVTLKKLGGNNPETLAEVSAGSMMNTAPDVATSIFRGQAAIKADKKWAPENQGTGAKASFATDMDKYLPTTVFSVAARTNPTGDYATTAAMVRARYADLSAQAADSAYSGDRVRQAVQDVTGGILYQNGAPLIAPARGMTQPQFDGVIAGLTDRDLDGVTDLNGRPISAAYLQRSGHLESVGPGRYLVNFASGGKPIYAFQYANTERPQPFVLDLNGRRPTQPPIPLSGVLGAPVAP